MLLFGNTDKSADELVSGISIVPASQLRRRYLCLVEFLSTCISAMDDASQARRDLFPSGVDVGRTIGRAMRCCARETQGGGAQALATLAGLLTLGADTLWRDATGGRKDLVDCFAYELHEMDSAWRRASVIRLVPKRIVRLEVCLAVFGRIFGNEYLPSESLITTAGQLAPMLGVKLTGTDVRVAYAHLMTQVVQDAIVLAEQGGYAAAMFQDDAHKATLRRFADVVAEAISDEIGHDTFNGEFLQVRIAGSIIQAHLSAHETST